LYCNFTINDPMKFISLIFFLFISQNLRGQWQDNFDDADFYNSPSWIGDTSDFVINNSLQLQLNAGAAGNSYLSTESSPNMFSELEWRVFIKLNFSPSSGNYSRVYLVSDQADLSGPLNGYYLQFGESLSDDAVELFRQDGSSIVSVCRASSGAIASSFAIAIKVTRDQIGLWSLWIDYAGGSNFVLEAYGAEAMYTSSAYFGVFCDYTSGNRTNFYFDDFYVGPFIQDTIAPTLLSGIVQSSTEIVLQFSEALDQSTAGNVANYLVDGGVGNPVSAVLNAGDPTKLTLTFSSPFTPAFLHTMSMDAISDLFGNPIDAGSIFQFTYYPPVVVVPHDILFTEIMFEPSSSGGLPNFEYVEIYNNRSDAVSLKDWTLSDGSSTSVFPGFILLPYTYLILCNASAEAAFVNFGTTLGLTSFPVLNNDVGDHLELKDQNGSLIDEVTFSNQTYRDAGKDEGGFSLERIDLSFPCVNPLNWKATQSALGGTPGNPNSVAGNFTDTEKPILLRVSVEDSVHILITFSEPMDTLKLSNPFMYLISGEGFSDINPDSIENTVEPLVYRLRIPFVIDRQVYRLSVQYGLKDCPGNDLENSVDIPFAIPLKADSADVVINEILFNPQSGGVDFVELYNRSDKILNIRRWRIAEAPFEDYVSAQVSVSVEEKQHLFFPGQYRVLTSDISDIRMRYDNPGLRTFISVDGFPDFNSTDGAVILYDSLGQVMDQFSYSEDQHYPLLIDDKGVSLERLSPEINSYESSNWHSASYSSGFATPGFRNSVGFENSGSGSSFNVEPSVFSPDNDGLNDLLFIKLKQDGEQGIAKVQIFNLEGLLIKELCRQVLVGDEYAMIWDGLNENGLPAAIGTYIIYSEVFKANGELKKFKRTCALTMR